MSAVRSTGAALAAALISCLCLTSTSYSTAVRTTLAGDSIPDLLYIGSHFIFEHSDTAWLNSQPLNRGTDYRFDNTLGAFDLRSLDPTSSDTLVLVYHPLPQWVPRLVRPPVEPGIDEPTSRPQPPERAPPSAPPAASDIRISGAKSFRFTSTSRGTSEFNQSLDMALSGDLAPGVTITGTVSDRGYDPIYGTANSQLNELDKINLSLTSPHFTGQIGDLTIVPLTAQHFSRTKRISGVTAAYTDQHLYLAGLAARPKGRFTTARFQGTDNVQGPYTIIQSGNPSPIVPGSETVWLNGRQLERGGSKDYTMDYPAGRITFTADNPIDSRSRIEIDYEPQSTAYRGELYSAAAGTAWLDSAVAFSIAFSREGDDSREPIVGSLTDTDRELLQQVGDSTANAIRSGVIPDTTGAYALVVDSLPDSVFAFVGNGEGDYSIQFSFVGDGNGTYRFVGGQEYRFVGQGQGDYAPIIKLQAPERLDLTTATLSLAPENLGQLTASVDYSARDRNLLSDLGDANNTAALARLAYTYRWQWHDQLSSVTVRSRLRESGFASRSRIDSADFPRRFLLADTGILTTTQRLHEVRTILTPHQRLQVAPAYARLTYDNRFTADRAETRISVEPTTLTSLTSLAYIVRTDRDSSTVATTGRVEGVTSTARADLRRWGTLTARHQFDKRRNNYSGATRGTRYHASTAAWQLAPLTVSADFYTEDTLAGDWRSNLDRLRLTSRAVGSLSRLTYDLRLTWQQVTQGPLSGRTGYEESSLLARLGSAYRNPRQRLSIETDYLISEETRNARGVTYLEVEPGTGDYIFEDGRYIPDPEGNFVRLEELLSDTERVRRGEKSFHFSRQWRLFTVRFDSRIEEELLSDGSRVWWWTVPFLSDPDQPYLYYLRRYDSELRAVPIGGVHLITFRWQDARTSRRITGEDRTSYNRTLNLLLKQRTGDWYLEQEGRRFDTRRDTYYNAGADITGYQLAGRVRRIIQLGELATGLRYRHAESGASDQTDLYGVLVGARLRVIERGELRGSVEFYTQDIRGTIRGQAYQFTENLTGDRGATWEATANYNVKGGVRANFTLRGRHSNDRSARVTVRGEVVASF
ncbi:hypothetical protein GF356_04715 [candidate division GN15 bacterium]|nr:hypothetical protein [candidate division GN15 bacterium]